MPAHWEIFGKVIDHYGDAGVCWRLSRQLAAEHALGVTLWLDDLGTLSRIAPGIDRGRAVQNVEGVTVRLWDERALPVPGADVIVEAFGCGLPEPLVRGMAERTPPPAWFVLEYLSAEAWIDGAHGLASPHPRLPIERRFWFPGFTPKSGGLLRERGLIEARNAFQSDAGERNNFWATLAIPAPAAEELRVSLFCYPNPVLPALFDAWADGDVAVTCLVPEGIAAGALDLWTGGNVPHRNHPLLRGRLAIHAIPFVAQDAYDRLLWACDVNFVRGEDSFVRAQWAARPFLWHVYPQTEGTHWRKLEAFVDRYTAELDRESAGAVRRCFQAWNGEPGAGAIADAWLDLAARRPQIAKAGGSWALELARQPDLACGLVKAVKGAL